MNRIDEDTEPRIVSVAFHFERAFVGRDHAPQIVVRASMEYPDERPPSGLEYVCMIDTMVEQFAAALHMTPVQAYLQLASRAAKE